MVACVNKNTSVIVEGKKNSAILASSQELLIEPNDSHMILIWYHQEKDLKQHTICEIWNHS